MCFRENSMIDMVARRDGAQAISPDFDAIIGHIGGRKGYRLNVCYGSASAGLLAPLPREMQTSGPTWPPLATPTQLIRGPLQEVVAQPPRHAAQEKRDHQQC